MDLPPPVRHSSNAIIQKGMEDAATRVQIISMKNAAVQEYGSAEEDDNKFRDIDVSCDGT
jgi:hypothetical protein